MGKQQFVVQPLILNSKPTKQDCTNYNSSTFLHLISFSLAMESEYIIILLYYYYFIIILFYYYYY